MTPTPPDHHDAPADQQHPEEEVVHREDHDHHHHHHQQQHEQHQRNDQDDHDDVGEHHHHDAHREEDEGEDRDDPSSGGGDRHGRGDRGEEAEGDRQGPEAIVRIWIRTRSGDRYAIRYDPNDSGFGWWLRPRWDSDPDLDPRAAGWLPTTTPIPWPLRVGEPAILLFPLGNWAAGEDDHDWFATDLVASMGEWAPGDQWPGEPTWPNEPPDGGHQESGT